MWLDVHCKNKCYFTSITPNLMAAELQLNWLQVFMCVKNYVLFDCTDQEK